MKIKMIFYLVVLMVSTTFYFSAFSMINQEDYKKEPIQSKQINKVLENYQNKTIVIPTRHHESDYYLDFLSEVRKGNIDYDLFGDLNLDDQNFLKEKLSLEKRHEWLTKKWQNAEVNFLQKIQKTQEHITKIQEVSERLLIEKIKFLRNKLKNDMEKIISNMEEICLSDRNNFFIFVFPEAYFNYIHNISKLGNFVPYKNVEKTTWMEIFKGFTSKNKNSLVVGNLIYIGKAGEISQYKENFLEFIVHSYNQKNILENYYKYDKLTINPVFNQSFVFYGGEEIFSHYKRFILDEDLPLKYLESILDLNVEDRLIYVPGMSNQEKHEDFYIEICQDHAMVDDKNENARINIIQSATLTLSEHLLKKLSGLFIHSDINSSECSVLYKQNKERQSFEKLESIEKSSFLFYNVSHINY